MTYEQTIEQHEQARADVAAIMADYEADGFLDLEEFEEGME